MTHKLDALIGPTVAAAWPIDAVHGDQYPGGGGGYLAAMAGYPHLTVPMGQVKGLPVGLSFIGLILGFISLFMNNRRKVFGIIGVILNGLLVFGFGALVVAGIIMQSAM